MRVCLLTSPRVLGLRGIAVATLLASTAFSGQAALAAAPTVKIGVGTLTSPSSALTQFSTGIANTASPTAASTRDPLVREMARNLDYDIDKIFAHVRDHVEFTPTFGLVKGSRGVILDNAGTAFDQAQFLVDMLREADAVASKGYSPKFVFGQISLNQTQFASWFGVTDADAARQVLADGGIPATVTGSGGAFTVVMAHVWVKATVGGTTYLFDPSLKTTSVQTGIDVKSAMSYSGPALLSAGTGSVSVNTATTIKGYDNASAKSKLTEFRGNLETYLNTPSNGLVGARIDQVVGRRLITPHPTSEDRRTSLPYVTASDRQWDGEVPAPLRTSLSVQVTGWSSPQVFYADQIYGKPLLFSYSTPNTATSSPYTGASPAPLNPILELDSGGLAVGTCDRFKSGTTATTPTMLTLVVDHPYAGGAGTYMDRTLIKQLSWRTCTGGKFVLTNDWGVTGDRSAELMRQALVAVSPNGSPEFSVGPELQSVSAQYSDFLRLAGNTLGGVYQVHDLIGVASLDVVDNEMTSSSSGGGFYTTAAPGLMLTLDFEAGLSVNPADAVSSKRRDGMVRVAQGGLAISESGVARQESDSPRDVTSLTLLTQQNTLATTAGDYPMYVATPANWTSTIRALVVSNYEPALMTILDGYIAEGYSLLLPQQGSLREPPFSASYPGGYTRTATLLDTAAVAGGASRYLLVRTPFFAFKAGGDGAYLIYDPRRQRAVKGGADVTVQDPSARYLSRPEPPKPSVGDALFSGLKVNGLTGSFSYAPPPDLVDGPAQSPLSLSLQRAYDPNDRTDYGLGGGWKHNWVQTISMNNDGSAAYGDKGAFGAASALVGIVAVSDLASVDAPTVADTPERLLTEAVAQQWLVDQTLNNVVTVNNGLEGGEVFLRKADGTLLSADPDGSTLVQTGTPPDTLLNRRVYQNVSFVYTGKYGDQKTYAYIPDPAHVDEGEPFDIPKLANKSFSLTQWLTPTGVKTSLTYQYSVDGDPARVLTISNNAGYSISTSFYSEGASGGHCDRPTETWIPDPPIMGGATFTTSSGRQVVYAKTPSMQYEALCTVLEPGTPPPGTLTYSYFDSVLKTVTMPAGDVWSYDYAAITSTYQSLSNPWIPNLGSRNPLTVLSALYRPSGIASSTPSVTIVVGLDGQVRTITDAAGAAHTYFSSPFYSEQLDPLGARTKSWADAYGQTIQSADPLGRKTASSYDGRGRAIRTVLPEGNAEDITYDIRSNQLTRIRRPKSTPTSGGITTSATYAEGPTVLACANIRVCNRPVSTTDGRGAVTDYQWDATYGDLTWIKPPADIDGVRPQTTFGYSLFGPTGVQFRLLTSKTDKITASQDLLTTYDYDTTNKFTLKWGIVDPSGLNLRTCIQYNTAGDIIGMSDARTATCPTSGG